MAAKKTAPKPAPAPTETREQKFRRLANKRVNKVIQAIRLVGNLASYPHSDDEASRIVAVIDEYVEALTVKMKRTPKAGRVEFEL